MRIAFIIEYLNYFKFYGPIISEVLRRGWKAACWHNYVPRSGLKSYLFPHLEKAPSFDTGAVDCQTYTSESDLVHLVKESMVDAIVSLSPKTRIFPSKASKITCTFVTLQNGLDTFLYGDPTVLASSDCTCLLSQYWLDWASEYFAAQGEVVIKEFQLKFVPRVSLTGFPELDTVAHIDPDEVRKRWNISQKQPVVLLLPITLANQHGSWPRIFAAPNRKSQFWNMIRFGGFKYWSLVEHGWNDTALTSAIRRFCDRNEAFLLVKGRRKDPIRPSLADKADKVLYDEADFPPTILEALSVSSLCIHFYSTIALEAAFTGCYGLCIDRPSVDSSGKVPLYTRMWRHGRPGHVYNYRGVTDWWTIPQVIEDLPNRSLADFYLDSHARKAYVEKFLGCCDGQSSSRVLDTISDLVEQRSK